MLDQHASLKISGARAMRSQGKYLREIALAFGVCEATASAWTRGILPRHKQAPDPRKAEILPVLERLYREGRPIPEIARRTGVPQNTLFGWRRELGLSRNRRSVYVTEELRARISGSLSRDPEGDRKEWAAKFYVEIPLSTPEIASLLRVSSVTVSNWLRQRSVRVRSGASLRLRQKLRAASLGSKRWNWKGGITPERIRLRVSLDMKIARERCFARDRYTCRSCGQRGGRLNAHHVWPFQRFQQWRYAVWNLVTLCCRCHRAFHEAAGGSVRMAIGPFFSKMSMNEGLPDSGSALGGRTGTRQ